MGEIKSVKVDNWGVFFLQKLQNFFNKTDYCDLTLQFRDNSQLKVHRLVLSACTDYFNVLEQTCEMVDDALIMPNELQADVVVPIVNFMYTGTLEFELKMYGKLLRTAKDMNMTVLLKLLEAHRRTMEGVNRMQRPPSPKPLRRRIPGGATQQTPVPQQRRLLSPNSAIGGQRRVVQTKTITTNTSSTSTLSPQQTQYRQQIGSTSLIRSGSANTVQARQQYSNQTLHETTIKQEPEEPTATSPFEQLRKGYNNNKRPASTTLMSPPTKKLNIEDVKEFAEQQRMRKQIAAEYGDDQGGEYESSMMEDDIHNDDDDDDLATTSANANANALQQIPSTSRQTQMQHGSTTITINQNEKPPTIVVKDSSNSKMNHAKIIKEVLRQYPHLVKSNKNIKLKIMPSSGDQPQKIIVKKEQLETMTADTQNQTSIPHQSQSVLRVQTSQQTLLKPMEKSQTSVQQQNVSQSAVIKMSPVQQQNHPPQQGSTPPSAASAVSSATSTATSSASAAAAPPTQKRRIDSKTMHALIALGAENTTGPWLCLRCGVNGRPISIPSYRGFRRHLINTHKEYIDPALCEHCGWRSNTKRELHFHMEVEHKVKTTSYTFPSCLLCSNLFLDTNALNQHMLDAHPDENKQQCIYCNKIFARELQLYNHMKTYHKKQALEDGIIDYSDEEFCEPPNAADVITQVQQDATTSKDKKESKIKIISDISLPSTGSIIELGGENNKICADVSSQLGISTENQEDYIDTNENSAAVVSEAAPKFVTVDGAEMVLTDEQRQEIMAQLNQEHGSGGVVMVLNEPTEYPTETHSSIATNDEEEKSQPETENERENEPEHEDEVMEDVKTSTTAAESSTADEEFDDSQIYNELHTTPQQEEHHNTDVAVEDKKNTSGGNSALDESKESIENLEWAENLISEHEMADQELEANEKEKENKNDDVINQKLKELTGDWSEDENDEELEQEEQEMGTANLPSADLNMSEVSSRSTLQNQITDDGSKDGNDEKKNMDQAKTTEDTIEKSIEEQDQAEIQSKDIYDEGDNNVAIPHDDNMTAEYATTPTIDDLPKGDEDDIDTLMKNLHKDDATSEVKGVEKESADGETEESAAVVDAEKEAIKDDMATTTTMLKDTQLAEDESTTIESGVKKNDDGPILSDNLITLERDVLLEDLISGTSGAAKEEFPTEPITTTTENNITQTTHVKATLESESSLMTTATTTEKVAAMEVDEEAKKAEDVDMTEHEQPATAAANVDDKDTDASLKDDVKETTTTTATTTTISSKKIVIDTNVDAVKPSERVKSLISEWGDDEEEEEEEADVESGAPVADTNTAAVDEEQL